MDLQMDLVTFHASSVEGEGSDEADDGLTTISPASRPPPVPTVFVCGLVAKRWHNGSLNSIITDLSPLYFVSCNNMTTGFAAHTKQLLANTECMLFFVNEYTLADVACLLALQYACDLMIPIVMLRPPRTKLVITARSRVRKSIVVNSNGTVVRSPSANRSLSEHNGSEGTIDAFGIDYALLQDILYEGYRIAVVYDRLEHDRSMVGVRERIAKATRPFHLTASTLGIEEDDDEDGEEENGEEVDIDDHRRGRKVVETVHGRRSADRLTTSDSSSRTRRPLTPGRNGHKSSKSPRPRGQQQSGHSRSRPSNSTDRSVSSSRMRLSQSMTSLYECPKRAKSTGPLQQLRSSATAGTDLDRLNHRRPVSKSPNIRPARAPLEPIKVDPLSSSERVSDDISPSVNTSLSSPFDRRLSMMSLDDVTNYTTTQYLVFPIHDTSRKPQLVRFPNDLLDVSCKLDSQWGSDSDIEEEVLIAPQINGDLGLLDESESRVPSPAPYNDPIA